MAIVLSGHTGRILGLALSADSRWLVTASEDMTAHLWDMAAKDPAATCRVLRGHTRLIRGVAISADGRWVVTGSEDKTAPLGLPRPRTRRPPPSCSADTTRRSGELAISPDGRWLVTASGYEPSPRLWDLTARQPTAIPKVLRGQDGGTACFAVSVDGRRLVTGSQPRRASRVGPDREGPVGQSCSVAGSITHRRSSVWPIGADGRWLADGSEEGGDIPLGCGTSRRRTRRCSHAVPRTHSAGRLRGDSVRTATGWRPAARTRRHACGT